MNKNIPTDPYIKVVLNKLANRHRLLSLRKIEEDTGLNRAWLSLFANGHIDDPSYTKIVTLDNYLSNYN